jgi:RimJ/RimL family protein N-acetyltransferase
MYTFNTLCRTGQPLHLREAGAGDAAQVLAYVHQIAGESDFLTFGPGEFTLTEAEEAQYLTACLTQPHLLYLLAFLEDKLVGSLNVVSKSRPRVQHVGDIGMSVLAEHQGQGIGAALLDACFDWALQGGLLRKINLQVRADNTRAIALYERKGFAHVGRLHQEMYLHGTYYDVLWMEKFLAVNPHS